MHRRDVRVSVIMPCYNSASFLDEAIASVLNQTFQDLELIVIDDGSTDDTLDIARQNQRKDPRVVVLPLPKNGGSSNARNAGIRIAKGEWLAILDSDDVAMPSRFEEQLRLVDRDRDLVMIGSSSISMDAQGWPIRRHHYPTKHAALLKRLLTMGAFPPHSSMLYKKEVLARLRLFNTAYIPSEDYDLYLRLAEVGRMASVDKALVRMRLHEQRQSDNQAGAPSVCMGFAAVICYVLRMHGRPDPSAVGDETEWRKFVNWIEIELTKTGYFERRRTWGDARIGYFAARNRFVGAFHFCRCLQRSGHALALVRQKLFGSSLPMRLARRWMDSAAR